MLFQSLDAVPTIDEIFEGDPHICKAVTRHLHTKSPVPLMLVTEEDVQSRFRNIGPTRIKVMKNFMTPHGLRFRGKIESPRRIMEHGFGKINDAPIAMFHVRPLTSGSITFTRLDSQAIITELEKIEPMMMVGDLLKMTEGDVRGLLDDTLHIDADQLRMYLSELNKRLSDWKLKLQPYRRLRAVV